MKIAMRDRFQNCWTPEEDARLLELSEIYTDGAILLQALGTERTPGAVTHRLEVELGRSDLTILLRSLRRLTQPPRILDAPISSIDSHDWVSIHEAVERFDCHYSLIYRASYQGYIERRMNPERKLLEFRKDMLCDWWNERCKKEGKKNFWPRHRMKHNNKPDENLEPVDERDLRTRIMWVFDGLEVGSVKSTDEALGLIHKIVYRKKEE